MRTQVRFAIVVSEDNDQLQKSVDLSQVIDDTNTTTSSSGTFTVAPNTVNQQILFPEVTQGKYLMIVVWDGEILARINDMTSQPISLVPNPATTPDPILPYQKKPQPGISFSGPMSNSAPLTSLFLSNPSLTAEARVQVAIVGEVGVIST